MSSTQKSSCEQYGRFLADGAFELVNEPPRKWENIHYNQVAEHEIYAAITNIGDGIVKVRDGAGCDMTLVAYDCRYVYIRDEDSGTVFNPAGAPTPQAVTDYSCRFYAAKTEIRGTCEGLRATQRVFVPREHPIEVTTLFLENTTERTRHLSVFAYAMFQLTGCGPEGGYVGKDNFAEVHPEIGGVFVTNRNTFVPTDRFKGYLVTLNDFRNGNGYRDHFLRSEFSVGTPRILWGWNCDGRPGVGGDCAATVQLTFEIPPHSSYRADFLLGQAANVAEVAQVRQAFSPEIIDRMCDEQCAIEAKRAATFQVQTGNPNYDALMNSFVKKALYSYNINKSGFRDNLQNDQALAMADYDTAEKNLLRALSSQYANGCVPHGFRPLNRLQYSDKPAWMLLAVPALIKESGNFSLLQERVPFFESSEVGSVWEHMRRAVHFLSTDLGVNGLVNQRHADWNDGLEATREAGERESIMVSQQLCYGLLEMEDLARRSGDDAVAHEMRELYTVFADRINAVAWDGEWYARTLCGDGYHIGSHTNEEGKIFINSQSWAVLSRIAPPERAAQCMNSLESLLGTKVGYRLCAPSFTKYDPRVGNMSNSMPGAAENGGCYNHAAGFKGVADCMLGRAENAWETFVRVAPDNPDNPISHSGSEPFSFNNCYTTTPYNYGNAGYAWRTGTTSWFTVLLVEWILGARRGYDGLLIDPCLSAKLPHAAVRRTFRGAVYDIALDNTAGRCHGAQQIRVDGQLITGTTLPLFSEGEHKVEVVI